MCKILCCPVANTRYPDIKPTIHDKRLTRTAHESLAILTLAFGSLRLVYPKMLVDPIFGEAARGCSNVIGWCEYGISRWRNRETLLRRAYRVAIF